MLLVISHWAGDYKNTSCVCVGAGVCVLVCHTDLFKTTTAGDCFSINCPNKFSRPCGLKPEDKRVIAILASLSKGLITQKLLQLELFLQICCSATLSLAIRWYLV